VCYNLLRSRWKVYILSYGIALQVLTIVAASIVPVLCFRSVSLVGHSLGSVITWDILSLLGDKLQQKKPMAGTPEDPIVLDDYNAKSYRLPVDPTKQAADVYRAYAGDSDAEVSRQTGSWGPSTLRKVSKTIPFVPKFTFFLGSPLGLFLTLRGARPLFDELRLVEDGKEVRVAVPRAAAAAGVDLQASSPFALPSGAVYNIFHPSDPVAYRIEPLLLPVDFDDSQLPKPCFVTLDGQGLRFHVQAKELGDSLVKTFTGLTGLFKINLLDKMPSQRSINSTAAPAAAIESEAKRSRQKGPVTYNFALGGESKRVDYQLQPGVVDNEYLSAVSAHSSYWSNSDLLDFLIQCASGE